MMIEIILTLCMAMSGYGQGGKHYEKVDQRQRFDFCKTAYTRCLKKYSKEKCFEKGSPAETYYEALSSSDDCTDVRLGGFGAGKIDCSFNYKSVADHELHKAVK